MSPGGSPFFGGLFSLKAGSRLMGVEKPSSRLAPARTPQLVVTCSDCSFQAGEEF